jgi:heme exporter protein A
MKLVGQDICVDRGWRRIVEDVGFSLDQGKALIVTGENGTGKSTLLRALAGLLPLSSGQLRLEDKGKTFAHPREIAGHMHYLGALNAMKPALTVGENLSFWQEFLRGDREHGSSVTQALAAVDLAHVSDLPFAYLSTGMKRRIAIARLLLVDRPVWIVDEPTSGLDDSAAKRFAQLAGEHCRKGGILIAATHLPLPIRNATHLRLERLFTFHEGDEMFDFPNRKGGPT